MIRTARQLAAKVSGARGAWPKKAEKEKQRKAERGLGGSKQRKRKIRTGAERKTARVNG